MTMLQFLEALSGFYTDLGAVSLISGISFATFFMYPFLLVVILGVLIRWR